MKEMSILILALTAIILLAGCATDGDMNTGSQAETPVTEQAQAAPTQLKEQEAEQEEKMEITSTAFKHKEDIPKKYTCQGQDTSPPLSMTGVPEGTESLALIVDDPDAPGGNWVHWVVWNIPPEADFEEGSVPEGAEQGMNDFKKHEYGGPCPPSGKHRYFFKLYALDKKLDIPVSSTKAELEKEIEDHVLERTEIYGLYEKEQERE